MYVFFVCPFVNTGTNQRWVLSCHFCITLMWTKALSLCHDRKGFNLTSHYSVEHLDGSFQDCDVSFQVFAYDYCFWSIDEAEAAKFAGLLILKIMHFSMMTFPIMETLNLFIPLYCSDMNHQTSFMLTIIDIIIPSMCFLFWRKDKPVKLLDQICCSSAVYQL